MGLTSRRGVLYFRAGNYGDQLWRSDGTDSGTRLVTTIGMCSDLVNVGGTFFFCASDNVHGAELWKSDGTAAGTRLVKDLRGGIRGSKPRSLVNVNGRLFFFAQGGGYGTELWTSNGTA